MTFYSSSYTQAENQYPAKAFIDTQCPDSFPGTLCEVCQKEDKRFLLTCITCSVSVHSYCYVVENEQNAWQCEKCIWEMNSSQIIECVVCRRTCGVIRNTERGWIHLICKNWPSYKSCFDDKCDVCGDTQGEIIACCRCWKTFHPYCGVMNGLKNEDCVIFCAMHPERPKKKRGRRKKLFSSCGKSNKIKANKHKPAGQVKGFDCENKENAKISLKEEISKVMNIRKGDQREVLRQFEDYLFLNCTVTNTGYTLSPSLSTLLGIPELHFSDLSKAFLRFCNN